MKNVMAERKKLFQEYVINGKTLEELEKMNEEYMEKLSALAEHRKVLVRELGDSQRQHDIFYEYLRLIFKSEHKLRKKS